MPRASSLTGSPKPWSCWESLRPMPTLRRGIPSLWVRATAFRTSGTRGTAPGVRPGLEGWRHVWLAKRHANVVSPDQWTEELALAMRTAVLEETSDVFVSAVGRQHLRSRGQV